VIESRFNSKVRRKTFYRKLWWIATRVAETPGVSLDRLYKAVKDEQPTEFQTPFKDKNVTVYQPVMKPTFATYIVRLKQLGVLREEEDLRLTQRGAQMTSRQGLRFNEILLEMVEEQFKHSRTSLENLDAAVRTRITTSGIPTAREIYLDVRRSERLTMPADWFSILIDLAAQTGYFRFASQKTYYPY